jgi:hypothetical protein
MSLVPLQTNRIELISIPLALSRQLKWEGYYFIPYGDNTPFPYTYYRKTLILHTKLACMCVYI